MFVVKTTKSSQEDTPSVDIQFQPNFEQKKKGVKKKPIVQRKNKDIYHSYTKHFNSPRTVNQQNKSIAYLLKDLNIPWHKVVKKELPTDVHQKSQTENQLPPTEALKENRSNFSTQSDSKISNETVNIVRELSEPDFDPSLINNICNSFENVPFSTIKQSDLEAEDDPVYHIIEISGNEEAHFDPSSIENISNVHQLVKNEEIVNHTGISKTDLSSESVQEDRNISYPLKIVKSKYDSSDSRESMVKKFTAEDIESMGKTALDLIYNYPGRKNLYKPATLFKPISNENSVKIKENVNDFISGNISDNDNGDCSGCEVLEDKNDETDESLAHEKAFSCQRNSTSEKRKSDSPVSSEKRMKVNSCDTDSLSMTNEKDEVSDCSDVDEHFDTYSEDGIGTDMSNQQTSYWEDNCKCFHYGNKSVIKIAPILKSVIEQRLCVIEVEIEDSLKVGKVQKMGSMYGKEMYYFTIEKRSDNDDLKGDQKLSKGNRKSKQTKPSKSKRKSVSSCSSKRQASKSKCNKSKILEQRKDSNNKSVKDNISTLLKDIDENEEKHFENSQMNDNQTTGVKHESIDDGMEATTLCDSDAESYADEETPKQCEELLEKRETANSSVNADVISQQGYEQNEKESVSSEKQYCPSSKCKENAVTDTKKFAAEKTKVKKEKVVLGDRLTELKEMYLRKRKIEAGGEMDHQYIRKNNIQIQGEIDDNHSDNSSHKDHLARGKRKQRETEKVKRYTRQTAKEGKRSHKAKKDKNNSKKLSTKSSILNQPIKTHTESIRFMCGVTECDSVFINKDLCAIHIEKEHPDIDDVCVIKVNVSELNDSEQN